MSRLDIVSALDAVRTPKVVLLRGLKEFYTVSSRFTTSRIIVDCCGRVDLPESMQGRFFLGKAEVICYSDIMEARLRGLGAVKIHNLAGPLIGDVREEHRAVGPVKIGFVPGDWSRAALRDALAVANQRCWLGKDVQFYSLDKFVGVTQVSSLEELVESSEVLVGSIDAQDLGEPSDAGLLAVAFGKGLISPSTSSIDRLGYTGNSYARVAKYTAGAYGAAIGIYLEHREVMLKGTRCPKATNVVDLIMEIASG